jgi:hypothetical protein
VLGEPRDIRDLVPLDVVDLSVSSLGREPTAGQADHSIQADMRLDP